MGSISLRELKNGFTGPEKKFHLRLRNCELIGGGRQVYTASRIRVTFDSLQEENSDKFLLTGQARGIALQILDPQGYPAHVGQAMPPLLLTGDEEKLDYTLRIVRDGKPLKAGNYYSVLRFRVDYE